MDFYTDLGCWKDDSDRAISKMLGDYSSEYDPILACAEAALDQGFKVFSLQYGGQCFSSADARTTHRKYGKSDGCSTNGRGGTWTNHVYMINSPGNRNA